MTELPRQSIAQGDAGSGIPKVSPGGPTTDMPPKSPVASESTDLPTAEDDASAADKTAVDSADDADTKSSKSFHRYPFYSPRFWHGMRPLAWFGLVKAGRFRIHPSRWALFVGVSFAAPTNTLLHWLQSLLFRKKLAAAELLGPPVFIVGHWRSGTTLLHELMVRDERLSSPSTFQCFAPHHFLVSEWFFRRYASWLLPGKRPMDNMAAGWERPQEDEFALLTLGLPSPYRRIAFPNEPPPDMEYLHFEGVADEDVQSWLDTLRSFLLAVSTSTGRPLIIKSPTHTGRVAHLAREFPDAKFIHITRDPRELFPSTCRLWQGLDEVQSLQRPHGENLESYVVDCFKRIYTAFHSQREQLDPSRLIDVRYEDLIKDPVATLRTIYQTLRLSDFDSVQPTIQDWVDSEHRDYKPNQHQLAPETEAMIRDAWSEYFERYGY